MGIIQPRNKEVEALKGLHLYHSAISNCAMRVRIVLEEKQLAWESHHLDLLKGETHTEAYFGINPYGVVPTLVDDGVVIIESDDIIEYLDDKYPEPPLRPADPEQRAQIHDWLKLATGIHVKSVKTFIYHNKMRSKLGMPEAELQRYLALQPNEDLAEFHRKSSTTGFSDDEVARATAVLTDCFDKIEAALAEHAWIVGDAFSLADIAWIPLQFTLIGANFDFSPYPKVNAWVEAIRERPSFQKGVLAWCPKF